MQNTPVTEVIAFFIENWFVATIFYYEMPKKSTFKNDTHLSVVNYFYLIHYCLQKLGYLDEMRGRCAHEHEHTKAYVTASARKADKAGRQIAQF